MGIGFDYINNIIFFGELDEHGKPVIYKVLSGKMQEDGYTFYQSVNGVWLVKEVPVRYLEKMTM